MDRLLPRRRKTRHAVRAVPTVVRAVASFLGGLIKRAGRAIGSIIRR